MQTVQQNCHALQHVHRTWVWCSSSWYHGGEERAEVWAAPRAAAQLRQPHWHGKSGWISNVLSLIRTSCYLPRFSLSGRCSITVWGLVLWNRHQSYTAALCKNQEISHFASKKSGQTRSHWCTWSMVFYKSTILYLNFFFRNSHFFSCFSLHLKCKLRSKDHFPTGRTHCIVCHFKMSSTVTEARFISLLFMLKSDSLECILLFLILKG